MLLPGVTYRCDCEVQSIDDAGTADSIRVFVSNRTSKLPIVSAIINMPASEPMDIP